MGSIVGTVGIELNQIYMELKRTELGTDSKLHKLLLFASYVLLQPHHTAIASCTHLLCS